MPLSTCNRQIVSEQSRVRSRLVARTLRALGVGVVVSRAAGAQRTTQLFTRDIASRATPATVTVVALGANGDTLGQGSGFFVRSSGILVTNWHVMQGAASAVVIRPNGERFSRVTFVDGDSAIDLVLLKVPGFALPVLTVRAETPEVGDKVVAIGSPLGLARTVTEGIVSAVRLIDGRQLVQISAPISHGSSGGAVLDAAGRVFAVSTSQLTEGQQLNFAVPVRYALGMLAETSRERSLGEVFGRASNAASVVSQQASRAVGASSSTGVSAPFTPPMRASVARSTLDGSWFGIEHVADSTRHVQIAETLHIAGDQGLIEMRSVLPGDTLADALSIGYVRDVRTTSDGRVAYSIGSMDYDGYQTNDGLFAGAMWSKLRAPQRSRIEFKHLENALTQDSGPYEVVEARTWYYLSARDQKSGDPVDWSGTLVVVSSGDSLDVVMSLHNHSGGTTGILGKSALARDGSFRVTMGKNSLQGTIAHGVINAQWFDARDNDHSFRGDLRATRR